MGQLITDIIDVPEMIGYVRTATAAEIDGLLSRLLPQRDITDGSLKWALMNIDVPVYEVAKFRAWDAPSPLGKRPGFVEIAGEVLPLGLSMRLNEEEIVRFNNFRAALANRTGGDAGTLADVYDDAMQTARAAQWRIQRARADVLVDGKVSITENGVVGVEADFGVPGTNIVTAATLWSDTTNAVPVTNLKAWQAVYRAANGGRNPAAWIVSTDVINDLTLNAQIRNLAPVTGVVPGIITAQTVGQVLGAQGVAPFVVFDGEGPNPTTGVMERLINARKVIGVPAANLGEVFMGTHPMMSGLVGRGIMRRDQAPGIVTWVEEETRPAAVITTSEAVCMPVLRDPKALFVATV